MLPEKSPFFKGRTTSGKCAVLNMHITVFKNAWSTFDYIAIYQERKDANDEEIKNFQQVFYKRH
jgi:hypothetical protein